MSAAMGATEVTLSDATIRKLASQIVAHQRVGRVESDHDGEPIEFTSIEEAEIESKARRIALVRAAHDRARALRTSPLVSFDALQKLDDLIQLLDDRVRVARGIRCVGGGCTDLIDQVRDLLLVHDSPSGVGSAAGTADAFTDTVGDASDTVGSPSPVSEAPSG